MEFSASFPGSLSPSRSAGTSRRGPWKRGCGISALVSRFARGETGRGVAKCLLFSQATCHLFKILTV